MLKLLSGFDIRSATPVDKRLIRTKAEMRTTPEGSMPNLYFCVCSDDGEFYLYNENNEASAETGKYKRLEVSGHEPTVYYYSPESSASKEEIATAIKEIAATLKPGDAIISKEGTGTATYAAFPNGDWDPISDRPLFASENNVYRYDIYGTTDKNITSKVQVIGSTLISLSDTEADRYFATNSQSLGYAACAPAGKGKLIPSSKTIMVSKLNPGYNSIEEAIEASVPTESLESGLKEWTLSFDALQ